MRREREDAYERNRRTLRTGESFRKTKIRNYDKYEENGRQIIRKCEILKQKVVWDIKT